MGLSCVAVLTYQPSQVQVARLEGQAQLLLSLSAGAGIRRLACGRVEFSAARAPEALVRLLGAVQQQHFILLIEAVKQSGNLIRQRHSWLMKTGNEPVCKLAICEKRLSARLWTKSANCNVAQVSNLVPHMRQFMEPRNARTSALQPFQS